PWRARPRPPRPRLVSPGLAPGERRLELEARGRQGGSDPGERGHRLALGRYRRTRDGRPRRGGDGRPRPAPRRTPPAGRRGPDVRAVAGRTDPDTGGHGGLRLGPAAVPRRVSRRLHGVASLPGPEESTVVRDGWSARGPGLGPGGSEPPVDRETGRGQRAGDAGPVPARAPGSGPRPLPRWPRGGVARRPQELVRRLLRRGVGPSRAAA